MRNMYMQLIWSYAMTNQMVTSSRLTGYIVNVMRSPVIERLMVRGSQVAHKHVFHGVEKRQW